MNLQGRNLSIDMQGEDVALIQRTLRKLGYDIPADEVDKQFFGPVTHTQVMAFQERNGLEATGVVNRCTIGEISRQVNTLHPHPKCFIVKGLVRQQGGSFLAGATVQAFDRDLRSQELLGKAITNADGYYEISYTSDQFSRSEKGTADLTFQAYTVDGAKYAISEILVHDAPLPDPKIIFNAPAEVWANITVILQLTPQLSEYEQLLEILNPVIGNVPLVDLTNKDVAFLIGDTSIELQRIEWLRQSALIGRETGLPTEVFYGFACQSLPLELKELLAWPVQSLRQALVVAIDRNIIPALLRQSLDDIVKRLEQLKSEWGLLLTYRVIGKLVNQKTGEPLVSYTVQGFALDSDSEPRAVDNSITNSDGTFVLTYTTSTETSIATLSTESSHRCRLHILNPQGQEIYQTEVEAKPEPRIIEIRVLIPSVPEPPPPVLEKLAATLQLELPSDLLTLLADNNIHTLEDIRRQGGIRQLEGLPIATTDPVIRTLEAHADLSRLSSDVHINAEILKKGYDSVAAIAHAPRTAFVSDVREALGDFKAAQFQVDARGQTNFLDQTLIGVLADEANGFTNRLGEHYGKKVLMPAKCSCKDCEAAVSPLAYLADLLDYSLKHLKVANKLITFPFLTDTFHQPFGDLLADCKAMDQQVRQVRICIEVLRKHLRDLQLPLAVSNSLEKAEKNYRVAAYTTLLSQVGTSYEEIRRKRNADQETHQALADRLAIEIGTAMIPSDLHLLFLDPSTTLTEQDLEIRFGLPNTLRNPLSDGVTLDDPENQVKLWNLTGVEWSRNTDTNGIIYVVLKRGLNNTFRVELYRDQARTQLVAVGERTSATGIVVLGEQNNSGLSGSIEIGYTSGSTTITLVAISWLMRE